MRTFSILNVGPLACRLITQAQASTFKGAQTKANETFHTRSLTERAFSVFSQPIERPVMNSRNREEASLSGVLSSALYYQTKVVFS